jgi:hypothetical protein
MRQLSLAALGLLCVAGPGGVPAPDASPEFAAPVRLRAEGVPIRVESPGFAAPCLADLDGHGKPDLLVGQFNKGKIRVFKALGGTEFAKGSWLMAGGKEAEVPGVW